MTRRDPNYIDAHVGARIRMRRQLINMSQERLGELLGITFQQVQKYENGTNRIGASNLFKIAKTLGVDVAYFFEGVQEIADSMMADTSEIPMVGIKEDPLTSRDAIELMHNYYRVKDANVRKRLAQFVKTLAHSGEEV